jgi:hypothetical protein
MHLLLSYSDVCHLRNTLLHSRTQHTNTACYRQHHTKSQYDVSMRRAWQRGSNGDWTALFGYKRNKIHGHLLKWRGYLTPWNWVLYNGHVTSNVRDLFYRTLFFSYVNPRTDNLPAHNRHHTSLRTTNTMDTTFFTHVVTRREIQYKVPRFPTRCLRI